MQHLRFLPTAAFVRRGAGAFAVAALALATIAPAASLAAGTPVATSDAYSTAEDTALVVAEPGVMVTNADANGIVGSGNDLENAALVTGPTHGTFNFNDDGSFSYAPLTNYVGPDSFTYRVVDDLGGLVGRGNGDAHGHAGQRRSCLHAHGAQPASKTTPRP